MLMNAEKLRQDFPSLQRKINGKPVIYFDNACMTLRPRQVIDAMDDYYKNYPGCAGRSNHRFGTETTEKYQEARKTVAKFIDARKTEEIIFTRNTTEGINLVAQSFGLAKEDYVLLSDREHNSNLIPWHMLAKTRGVTPRIIKSKDDFTFNTEKFAQSLGGVKLVSLVWSSNIDGYTLPVREIIKISHEQHVPVLLDAAQAVPHFPVSVRKLDADFIAFSGHKMLGPTGTGVLYGKSEQLEKLQPFMTGGDTVEYSTYDSHKFLKPPERFEAGLQNYAGAMGLGAAAKYLQAAGMEDVYKHECQVAKHIREELSALEGIQLVGVNGPGASGGVVSFNLKGLGFHEVAIMLDHAANIMIRSGQHCAHSWFTAQGIKGSARASLYLYNTMEEAETFVAKIKEIAKLR
jgi:cysteine desulfurase/selenocysteine lyase